MPRWVMQKRKERTSESWKRLKKAADRTEDTDMEKIFPDLGFPTDEVTDMANEQVKDALRQIPEAPKDAFAATLWTAGFLAGLRVERGN